MVREEVGKYRVIRMLGKGPRGDVYLVQHMRLRVNRAMRAITPDISEYEGTQNV